MLDINEFLDTLDRIEEWCKYRNEIVHALLNKNKQCVYSELEELAVDGMNYARSIDSKVHILKRSNSIRKSINAPS